MIATVLKSLNFTLQLLATISIAVAAPTTALAETKLKGFVVDRLALVMTGKPATPQQIASYESGSKSLLQIAEELKMHPNFEDKLAQFWVQVLGINAPTGFEEFFQIGTNGNLAGTIGDKLNLGYQNYPATTIPPYYNIGNYAGGYSSSCSRAMFPDPSVLVQSYYSINYPGASLTADQKARLAMIYDNGVRTGCGCADGVSNYQYTPVPVAPWWNPNIKVLACPGLLDAGLCGANLQKCWPGFNVPAGQINDMISYSLAMEPGYLIAKTVVEDRPWPEILTTKEGAGNAAFLTFISRPEVSGEYRKLSGGADPFPGIASNPALPDALADPSGRILLTNTGSEFARYTRAGHHAGVLTTAAFVRQFNGARAYANSSRQTFLCREFTVPEGVAQVVSSEPDLTKKPFCSTCHITLEPLSDFWRAWPAVGQATFYYYPTGRDQSGAYNGVSGSGVVSLASIYADTHDFDSCAVKRSFEFLVGRSMSPEEMTSYLPPLTDLYRSKGEKVWPVMLEIIASPAFTSKGVSP